MQGAEGAAVVVSAGASSLLPQATMENTIVQARSIANNLFFILLSFLGFSCCKVKGFSEGDKTFFPILKRDIPIKKKQLT